MENPWRHTVAEAFVSGRAITPGLRNTGKSCREHPGPDGRSLGQPPSWGSPGPSSSSLPCGWDGGPTASGTAPWASRHPQLVMVMHMVGACCPWGHATPLPLFPHSVLPLSYRVIILILQMRTVRLRESKQSAPGHTAGMMEPGSALWSWHWWAPTVSSVPVLHAA